MPFKKLGLSPLLVQGIAFEAPFEIQQKAIPIILNGENLHAIAETGSGKTASYVWPILERFLSKKISRSFHLKVLVLVPTRELAMQVAEEFEQYAKSTLQEIKTLAIFGGVPLNQQMVKLKNTEILVATPGRLLDMVSTNSVHLGKIETLVIDEADKMLDMGFRTEMEDIFRLLPSKRQNILFSATENAIENALKLTFSLKKIKVEPQDISIEKIKQSAYMVSDAEKGPFLRHLINHLNISQALIFVSSVRTADNLVTKLQKNGFDAGAFHSKKTQNARISLLQNFKNKKCKFLVATDLAGRGIDILELPFVINYELPRSPKDYIHRIGRTGRANESGEAITLFTPEEEPHFYVIQKKMGKKVEKITPESTGF